MTYILTEDSAGGYQFWRTLCQAFELDARVISTEGATNLYGISANYFACVDKFLHHPLKSEDNLIICYDLFNRVELNPLVVSKAFRSCPGRVFMSRFTCIESVILGFTRLECWLGLGVEGYNPQLPGISTNISLTLLSIIRNCLVAYEIDKRFEVGIDPRYVNSVDEHILEYVRFRANQGVRLVTAEDVCADLLMVLTFKTGWKIDKSLWHECWTQDCCWDLLSVSGRVIERRFAKTCNNLNKCRKDRELSELHTGGATLEQKFCELVMFSELNSCFIAPPNTKKKLSLFDIVGYPASYKELQEKFCDAEVRISPKEDNTSGLDETGDVDIKNKGSNSGDELTKYFS